ncbi:DUF4258 domain-containing protein [Hydrogenimonas sp.]
MLFRWSDEKNAKLKQERRISFEDIMIAYESGHVLDVLENPSGNFPDQKVLVVEIDGYAYVVPFVEESERWFLKTVYPSRKMTKIYLEGDE